MYLMRRLFVLAALLWAVSGPAYAGASRANLKDNVPGQPDVTYLDLVRKMLPDVADESTSYSATPPGDLRHVIAEYIEPGPLERGIFYDVEVAAARTGGKDRLVVLLDFGNSAETNGFALLGLFGFDNGPALLDLVNVSLDRDTFFLEEAVMPVSATESVIVTGSFHHNSSQGYMAVALMMIHADRIDLIDDIWMLSDRTCAYDRGQASEFHALNSGEPFGDIEAKVVEMVEPTNQTCGDDDPRFQPSRRDYRVVYRWNDAAKRYEPGSDDFERLAAINEDRY